MILEVVQMDDSDSTIRYKLKKFKDIPIYRLILRQCNLQEKNTQLCIFQDTLQLYIIKSFIKFWIKDKIKVKQIILEETTIIYGKSSIPVFSSAKKFICTNCYIKNPEFAWRPITEVVEELVLLGNDYYGVIQFNIVYHVVLYQKKFVNLKRLEFEGQIDEDTFIKLLVNLHMYQQLE